MTASAVHDPGFAADYFFVVPHTEGAPLQRLNSRLQTAFNKCSEAAGSQKRARFQITPELTENGHPLDGFRKQVSGEDLAVAVWPVQDTVWFQHQCQHFGDCALNELPPLKVYEPDVFHEPPAEEATNGERVNYLGLVRRYHVEFDPALPTGEIEPLARRVAKSYFPDSEFAAFRTSGGLLLLHLGDTVVDAVLAYPKVDNEADDGAVDQITTALHRQLPHLLLCYFKVRNVGRNLTDLLANAREADEALQVLIAPGNKSNANRTLERLQVRTDEVTNRIEALTENVLKIERLLNTLEIDRQTAGLLLGGLYAPSREKLLEELVDKVGTRQKIRAEARLGYCRITVKRAQIHWESLGTTIELQQADRSTKLALVMGGLACLQLFALLPLLFQSPSDDAAAWDFRNWWGFFRVCALGAAVLMFIPLWKWIRKPTDSAKLEAR